MEFIPSCIVLGIKSMHPYLYALLCVVLPILWGLVIVGITNRIQARRPTVPHPTDGEAKSTMPEYHI